MNDQPTPINKDHLKKLIRAELELTWFDNKSDSPDMSWVTPTVIETLFTELITHTRGNQSKAARMLGINRGSFSKKLNQITSNELGLVESL
ncbi:DNA binding HTH domain-containing protein [Vibrio crassostreae]|uniref:helix-turn-helix domain-containing protein n=1 Tax=Vibrio TaxID=662 RepID=UPI0005E300A2|nr:helix-turn-helix domain-containing protein [Vibrio crassostreae]CAH7137786.1 HTH_8 domain-containing protein [Vibrio chagasii]TDW04553.1 Fis family transcriptional regulator [Vibrio crassostreae]CAK1796852.1 DNA binding HTH domain-containing protein [Vibrio crassostreae]CAK1922455.1 DNA binding HTH domain-containing protein [Vibrio crassostreae]CAK1927392.1 DNA binding HTH domain-containing protein [Vibrio crassostreae]